MTITGVSIYKVDCTALTFRLGGFISHAFQVTRVGAIFIRAILTQLHLRRFQLLLKNKRYPLSNSSHSYTVIETAVYKRSEQSAFEYHASWRERDREIKIRNGKLENKGANHSNRPCHFSLAWN